MPALEKIHHLTSSIPGFPDLKIDPFKIPPFPDEVLARFPKLSEWKEEFEREHEQWRSQLQNSIREALQALEAQKTS